MTLTKRRLLRYLYQTAQTRVTTQKIERMKEHLGKICLTQTKPFTYHLKSRNGETIYLRSLFGEGCL